MLLQAVNKGLGFIKLSFVSGQTTFSNGQRFLTAGRPLGIGSNFPFGSCQLTMSGWLTALLLVMGRQTRNFAFPLPQGDSRIRHLTLRFTMPVEALVELFMDTL